MKQEQIQLLSEQIKKLENICDVLRNNFSFEDEMNFLAIVKHNLEETIKSDKQD